MASARQIGDGAHQFAVEFRQAAGGLPQHGSHWTTILPETARRHGGKAAAQGTYLAGSGFAAPASTRATTIGIPIASRAVLIPVTSPR